MGATVILSMSSAPIGALALQVLLMMWNWLLRSVVYRWKIIWALILASLGGDLPFEIRQVIVVEQNAVLQGSGASAGSLRGS